MTVSLEQIIKISNGKIVNPDKVLGSEELVGVAKASGLKTSRPGDVAFFFSKSYQNDLWAASPTILVTSEAFIGSLMQSGLPLLEKSIIVSCKDPYLTMAKLSEVFAGAGTPLTIGRPTIIDPTAVIAPSVQIGRDGRIESIVVISDDVQIGDRVHIYPGCYVGKGVILGDDVTLFPGVKIYESTTIANRVRIHAGAVIGADGFGYAPVTSGAQVPIGHQKIFHFGRVLIGSDVEIGANTCIDRGTLDDTIIEDSVKIDNLVQIGHNVILRKGAVICGTAGLAGSCEVGSFTYIGGKAGIVNKIIVGDYVKVAACTLITKNIPSGGMAAGNPQREPHEHFKVHALLNRLIQKKKKYD